MQLLQELSAPRRHEKSEVQVLRLHAPTRHQELRFAPQKVHKTLENLRLESNSVNSIQ